jgi:hypothetical protein
MRRVEGYANFDKSEFGDVESLSDKDVSRLEAEMHDLGKFIDPKSFKSYEALQTKFDSVVNGRTAAKKETSVDEDSDEEFVKKAASATKSKKVDDDEDAAPKSKKSTKVDDDDDDDLAFFKKLAEDE